jgi:hypothetical protein
MDNPRAAIKAALPALLDHEGVWEGTYRHIDPSGATLDVHGARIICEFPAAGPIHYIQRNRFTWTDGRTSEAILNGVLRDGRLWWDEPGFRGSAWTTHEGLILLDLDRKDDPGARFFEIIVMAPGGRSRARTWHWFKDGRLQKRTLCDETRVA